MHLGPHIPSCCLEGVGGGPGGQGGPFSLPWAVGPPHFVCRKKQIPKRAQQLEAWGNR